MEKQMDISFHIPLTLYYFLLIGLFGGGSIGVMIGQWWSPASGEVKHE
jgi:hypothetical protein